MSEPTLVVGIDPGKGGGIAWRTSDGLHSSHCCNMPGTPHDLAELLGELKLGPDTLIVYVEKVHSFPRDGVASAFKFGRQLGTIHGVLAALGISFIEVSPQKWQKIMELPRGPGSKQDRKRAIKAAMQARYPHLKVTLKTADALGILTYAREIEK